MSAGDDLHAVRHAMASHDKVLEVHDVARAAKVLREPIRQRVCLPDTEVHGVRV
jgi:hypothetical protein